jgi:dTDP-4-dehydrorhamnose reductase
MKILLFGKNGQVGWELQRSLEPLGELIALSRNSTELCGDLTDLNGIAKTVRTVAPDAIINAAAYTAVDKAESETDLAYLVNALAPDVLAKEAKRNKAWLIHYSTDYVFNGNSKCPKVETDSTDPLNVYGKTKLEGEQFINASNCLHLIFRTSWVYAAHGNNFIKTMLRLAQDRDHLNIIDDQIGAPTGADLLADITAHTIRAALHQPTLSGIYHLVASGNTSWHGYANLIFDFAKKEKIPLKIQPESIFPVLSNAFPTPAKRPLNSRLNTQKLQNTFGLNLPPWQTGVKRTLEEILVPDFHILRSTKIK